WCFRLPDHFIPVSHWVSREITALGVSLKKQTVVYDGIALEKLDLKADPSEFRGRFGIPENAFAVGLIGLLIPWKGQNLFIDAAKGLSRKIPNLKMMIVGGTPDEFRNYEKELRNRVVREGLRDVVVFTGHLSSMSHVYMGMDVVVSASISPEPLGTMVIECMAMGCPLIVPSHGGGAEMNRDGETALIFQAGNAESLESTILKLYREPETGKRLGQNAREKALRTFDIATHARCVQTIYDKVLDIRK
ncbi:MAG: glycosyltransferase family 4 protein, partial [Acidobacteria bacterium]|nr:glycosyltransferase family 4 protein [Acidobacteriota bacterium]